MSQLKFSHAIDKTYLRAHEIDQIQPFVELAYDTLLNKTGAGSEYTDWVNWPDHMDIQEFERIQKAAEKINETSDVLIVIGIGGSYLGARAAIEFLNGTFYNLTFQKEKKTQVFFAGNNISATYHQELLHLIEGKDFSINVISKSGTTTEPSIAFRLFKEKLIEKYGHEEANRRIYATTDAEKGALKSVADQEGHETFVIPDGIGGRFTVLTAVGLLPIAVAGGDIKQLMVSAKEAFDEYINADYAQNDMLQYVAIRNVLHRKGKNIEILANYEPSLQYFAEWWKQLFGESEGKDMKGIFPMSANFSTDLHSIGQIIQDGIRNIFETVITIANPTVKLTIPAEEDDLDQLGYIEGKDINEINHKAFLGTQMAHAQGGVPNLHIELEDMTEASLAYLIVFFELAVGVSGYLTGINPFNQPGVEDYKRNMFALLKKPGYEDVLK